MPQNPMTVIICGPTASGKSDIAHVVVERLHGAAEIVSADSMQVYRGLDIGTAKPSPDDQLRYHYHLVDIRDPDQQYSAADFRRDAVSAIEEIKKRGNIPLIVGGTGLYIRALVDGVFEGPARDEHLREQFLTQEETEPGSLYMQLSVQDPVAAEKIGAGDIKRIIRALEVLYTTGSPISQLQTNWKEERTLPADMMLFGITVPRSILYQQIDRRVDGMMAAGFFDEVTNLTKCGYREALLRLSALGYRELIAVLDGEDSLDHAVEQIKQNTRRFAKRQLTWFRHDPRIRWLDASPEHKNAAINELSSMLPG